VGQSLEHWQGIPLSKDWLLSSNDCENDQETQVQQPAAHRVLLLETNLSPSFDTFLAGHQDVDRTVVFRDRARLATHIIAHAARRNGVLSATPASADSSTDEIQDNAALVNVVIGSRGSDSSCPSTIWIDGWDAVARDLRFALQQIGDDSKLSIQPGQDYSAVAAAQHEAPRDPGAHDASQGQGSVLALPGLVVSGMMGTFEALGTSIRKGLQAAVHVVRHFILPARSDKTEKVVYVLSDHPIPAQYWFSTTLVGWKLRWCDANDPSGNETCRRAITSGTPCLVTCSRDETTCNVALSLLQDDTVPSSQFMVLLEHSSSENTLRELLSNRMSTPSTLSVESVHESLFAQAEQLLLAGKTPSEVEQLMK
jgi:hypothetical protein